MMNSAAALQRLRQRITTDAPRVICIGLTAFDETWEVADLLRGSGKQRAALYREGGGGMAANAAAAVAQLGGRAVFWGRAGHDRAGEVGVAQVAEDHRAQRRDEGDERC